MHILPTPGEFRRWNAHRALTAVPSECNKYITQSVSSSVLAATPGNIPITKVTEIAKNAIV